MLKDTLHHLIQRRVIMLVHGMQASQIWVQLLYLTLLAAVNMPTLTALHWVLSAANCAFTAVTGSSLSMDRLMTGFDNTALQNILVHLVVPLLVLVAMGLMQTIWYGYWHVLRICCCCTVNFIFPAFVLHTLPHVVCHGMTHFLCYSHCKALLQLKALAIPCLGHTLPHITQCVQNPELLVASTVLSAACSHTNRGASANSTRIMFLSSLLHRWAKAVKKGLVTGMATSHRQMQRPHAHALPLVLPWKLMSCQHAQAANLWDRLRVTLLSVPFYYYPSLLMTSLSLFACYPTDPEYPAANEGFPQYAQVGES